MSAKRDGITNRTIKKDIYTILDMEDFVAKSTVLKKYDSIKLLSPLFSTLCSSSSRIRWHGIYAFGQVVADLADKKIEKARMIMRRFMWSLNDESGGIGWGAPEAMGEIMARHKGLAQEFHMILISYIYDNPDPFGADNYLEYLPLRRGAFWGIARLAQAYPEFAGIAGNFMQTACEQEKDAEILGLICLYAQKMSVLRHCVAQFIDDERYFLLFWNGKLQTVVLKDLAKESLQSIQQ